MKVKNLTSEQAAQLSNLLDEVLALPPPLRTGWLDELARRESGLHGLVAEVLSSLASADASRLLETDEVIVRHFDAASRDAEASLEGRSLGPYRIERLLATGGMGSVWLAERADGLFARRVALKLVRADIGGRALGERFARERAILAALNHPHIARLLDAGVADGGQAYLAIEFVDGLPLNAYCDAKHLSIRSRVELVIQVLEAVQYAHQNLVVHRDLKPSNILVSVDGQAHLLDFGIAKLVSEAGQAPETELTQLSGHAFTPDYASPEQIGGRAVATSSDIYSTGVLLYELLCGRRPYRLMRNSRGALEDAILDADPIPPSQLAPDSAIAQARSTTSTKLAKAIAGDLDTIVLKALKKSPAERYATADAFRLDLQRHLNGEAVLARPDSRLYRAGKFIARHRAGVAAMASLILALGAGLAGTLWQFHQAQLEARRAVAVQGFLESMFDEAEPAKARGRELTARQLLDRGQRDLHSKLAGQPRLNAELDGVLANLFVKLDAQEMALPLAQARLKTTLELDGAHSLSYGDALDSLAQIQSGLLHYEEAYETYLHARDVLSEYSKVRQRELLRIERHRAFELEEMQRHREAADVIQAALPRMEAQFGAGSWDVISSKSLLSVVYSWLGDRDRAAALGREIEPLLDTLDPANVLDAVNARNDMAIARLATWQPDEAATLLLRALADWDRLVGADTLTAINFERTLALALSEIGEFEQAAQRAEDNVQRAVRTAGEASPATKLSESFAVRPLILMGRPADALAMARRSLESGPASGSASTAPLLRRDFENRLGLALVYSGKADEASELLEKSVAQARRSGLDKGDVYGRTLHYLAGAYAARGQFDAAARASDQAAQVFERSPTGADMYVARAQLTEALAFARMGQATHAQQLVDQADAHLLKVSRPEHPIRLLAQIVRAEALRAAGQRAEAEQLDRNARERLRPAGAFLPRALPMVF